MTQQACLTAYSYRHSSRLHQDDRLTGSRGDSNRVRAVRHLFFFRDPLFMQYVQEGGLFSIALSNCLCKPTEFIYFVLTAELT